MQEYLRFQLLLTNQTYSWLLEYLLRGRYDKHIIVFPVKFLSSATTPICTVRTVDFRAVTGLLVDTCLVGRRGKISNQG